MITTKERARRSLAKRSRSAPKAEYPHITRKAGVVGGEPIVRGTRTSVRAIAGYYQTGKSVDEIVATLRHLTQAQVHAALAYYFDNKDEIDTLMKENSNVRHWKGVALVHPRQGR